MTDEEFFERLHNDAQQLRYQPADDSVWTRLQARIGERVHAQPNVALLLAGWFRPIATALAALSIAAAISVQWMDRPQQPATVEAMATSGAPSTNLGDAFGVE